MTTFTFELFWSMRSPYCYLALDRLLALRRDFDLEIDVRPVYPIAVRDPDFFRVRASKHYRPYQLIDTARVAERHGIPFRRPVPDPTVQNLETGEIAAEQPYVFRLTRLAQLAAGRGAGMAFLDQVARLIWDGGTDGWDEGTHLADAMGRAGLDGAALLAEAEDRAEAIDVEIRANEAAQEAAGHGGVPLMVFEGEPFFGQDRLELLLWRMQQRGLRERD